jgi:hypothetical protein
VKRPLSRSLVSTPLAFVLLGLTLSVLGVQPALAQTPTPTPVTYLVQERGGIPAATGAASTEPATADYTAAGGTSPWGIELPMFNAITGYTQKSPTEPLGCFNSTPGQSCWDALGNTNGAYGWPKTLVTPNSTLPNDTYYVEPNFWNNHAVLGDQTKYTAGSIAVPGAASKSPSGRLTYPTASPQYVLPHDFPAPIDGVRFTNCDDASCYTSGTGGEFVKGKLEIAVNPTDVSPIFWISASDVVSRHTDGTKVDERYYPAAYPTILKGCHTTLCTDPASGGVAGAPFPIQIQDLGRIPSHWSVTVGGEAGTVGNRGMYDVAYDIWLDIGRRPGDCVAAATAGGTQARKHCFFHAWNPSEKSLTGVMPEANPFPMQNYGTEIMIWLGYNDGNNVAAGDGGNVQPSGRKVASTTIGGYTWDVWVGHGRDPQDPSLYWNIVSFIRPQGTWDNFATTLNFTTSLGADMDTQPFIQYMLSMTGADGVVGCPIGYDSNNAAIPPSWNTTTPTNPGQTFNSYPCAKPDWWLTDIDAGFEFWDRGQGLQTNSFTVHPTFAKSISSERVATDGTTPVFNWQKYIQLWQNTSCAGTMTYDIHSEETFDFDRTNAGDWAWCDSSQNGGGRWYSGLAAGTVNANPTVLCSQAVPQNGPPSTRTRMVKLYPDPDGLGGDDWYALVPPVFNRGMHGPMQVHFYCDSTEVGTPISIYIDPSGRVMAAGPDGTGTSPLHQATVTLLKQDGGGGWAQVANGDTAVMDPTLNTRNSDRTAYDGAFGWNVAPGTYKVQTSMPGCHKVGEPSQPIAETGNLVVANNPIVNLELLLDCNKESAGNLDASLSIVRNWTEGGPGPYGTGGYCATVNGTNYTGAPLDWTAVVATPDPGTIYTSWNGNFTLNGTTLTVSGMGWNNELGSGDSLSSVGFCAYRGPGVGSPPPTTFDLSVSKAGTGSGTVTSSPAGIDCGSTCTAGYTSGTSVTLTATPAAGSVFAGWSGACSGTGTCTVAMSAARSVTATFNSGGTCAVTVTPVIYANGGYYNQEVVRLSNTETLTALSVEIVVRKTTGLKNPRQYSTVGDAIQAGNSTSPTAFTFDFALKGGRTLSPGASREFVAQTDGSGTVHPTSGDTYTVTATCGGGTTTRSGSF